jgi:hypothetical protein
MYVALREMVDNEYVPSPFACSLFSLDLYSDNSKQEEWRCV